MADFASFTRALGAALVLTTLAACDRGTNIDSNRFLHFPAHRARCTDRNANKNVYFGDLHVHTRLSFDAANADTRNMPVDAYRFARGEAVGLPPFDANGNPSRMAQLSRPLDFAAVTDHSEFLAETSICLDPSATGYDSESCVVYRDDMRTQTGSAGDFFLSLIGIPPERRAFCANELAPYCMDRVRALWEGVATTAEQMDDRSSDCAFSTFIAYEWSGSVNANNWHRNVIFGGSVVPRIPTSFIEAWTPERLWDALHETCLDAGVGCDVLTIPHNGNISGGRMFLATNDLGDPYTAELSARRRAMEPLVEIYQHKGASECTPGDDPLGSTDEDCEFELLVPQICIGPNNPAGCTPICGPNASGGFIGSCVAPKDFARAALRNGLAEWARTGENPFAFGFIGSTDTHSGTPGATEEDRWQGHVGLQDATPAQRLSAGNGIVVISRYSSPGGLAAVWSEENSRPSIFSALRRREAFGTSGTRIVLRLFGGFGYDSGLCSSPDLVTRGYASGVPMGGDLVGPGPGGAPSFIVQAQKDPDGADLQRVEIVKGWFDGNATHEQVYLVAGDANNGATVDPNTCVRTGPGSSSLCSVWTDPAFDPAQVAFYYVRVLENPSCRWHRETCNALTYDCTSMQPSDPLYTCCDPAFRPDVQERAWSSPIWYYPATP